MIVFDASTLILLAKAELLERFLEASGMEAVVPREVARETCEAKQSFDALLIQRLIDEKKIGVEGLRDRTLFEKLRREVRLGAGEAEAIALAVAKRARIVATDDRNAINACKLARMPFTSALAVLVRLHENRVIDKGEALLKLATLEREGRYKKSIIAEARSRLEAE
jgi:predicted nucleic acid-binding protein